MAGYGPQQVKGLVVHPRRDGALDAGAGLCHNGRCRHVPAPGPRYAAYALKQERLFWRAWVCAERAAAIPCSGASSIASEEGGIYAPVERHSRRFDDYVLEQLGHKE